MSSQLESLNETRNYIVVTSILFLIQRFTPIAIEGNIPLIDVSVPSKEDSLLLLAAMSFYFTIRLCIDWFKVDIDNRKSTAAKLDFLLGIFLSLTPILITIYDLIIETPISDLPIISSLLLLGVGEFIAATISIQVINFKYIRNKAEALQKGLPRIPVAIRRSLFYIPINIILVFVVYIFSLYLFTEPLSSYWLYLLCLPLLIHIPVTIYEFFGKSKEYHSSVMKVFDQHDTHYQLGGWDKQANHVASKLYDAAENNNLEIVVSELNNGADPNEINRHGWSPFLISVAQGHTKIMELCIEYGADVNQSNSLGRTALMFASRYGKIRYVQKLLDNGADINATDSAHSTALMVASQFGHKGIVELLINNGADITLTDHEGKTALYYAVINQQGHIAKILRKNLNIMRKSQQKQ